MMGPGTLFPVRRIHDDGERGVSDRQVVIVTRRVESGWRFGQGAPRWLLELGSIPAGSRQGG